MLIVCAIAIGGIQLYFALKTNIPVGIKDNKNWITLAKRVQQGSGQLDLQFSLSDIQKLTPEIKTLLKNQIYFVDTSALVTLNNRNFKAKLEIVSKHNLQSLNILEPKTAIFPNEVMISPKWLDECCSGKLPLTVLIKNKNYQVVGVMPNSFFGLGSNHVNIWLTIENASDIFVNTLEPELAEKIMPLFPLFTYSLQAKNSLALKELNGILQTFKPLPYSIFNGIDASPLRRSRLMETANTLISMIGVLLVLVLVTDILIMLWVSKNNIGNMALHHLLGASTAEILRSTLFYTLLPRLVIFSIAYYLSNPAYQLLSMLLTDVQFNASWIASGEKAALWFAIVMSLTYTFLVIILTKHIIRNVPQHLKQLQTSTRLHYSRFWLHWARYQLLTTVVLVTFSATLALNLWRLNNTEFGFNVRSMDYINIQLPNKQSVNIHTSSQLNSIQKRFYEKIFQKHPNEVAYAQIEPMTPPYQFIKVLSVNDQRTSVQVAINRVSQNFFSVMGMNMLQGHSSNFYKNVVVNESFMRNICHCSSINNQMINIQGQQSVKIVGIVSSGRYYTPHQDSVPTIYFLGKTPNATILFNHNILTQVMQIQQQILTEFGKNIFTVNIGSLQSLVERQLTTERNSFYFSLFVALLMIIITLISTNLSFNFWKQSQQWLFGLKQIVGAQKHDIITEFYHKQVRPMLISIWLFIPILLIAFDLLSTHLSEVSYQDIWLCLSGVLIASISVWLIFSWHCSKINHNDIYILIRET